MNLKGSDKTSIQYLTLTLKIIQSMPPFLRGGLFFLNDDVPLGLLFGLLIVLLFFSAFFSVYYTYIKNNTAPVRCGPGCVDA